MNDQAAVTQTLTDYYSAFSTLNVQAILPYFHEPCLLIGPQGVFAAPSSAVLAAVLTPAMEDLRAKGYARSELSMLQIKPLSATATLASGVALRYNLDGQELDRVGVTYLLNRAGIHWKIALLVIHDADRALRHESPDLPARPTS